MPVPKRPRRIRLGKFTTAIVELMRSNPQITIPEIAQKLSRTERAIEFQITRLGEDQIIGRVGSAKGRHWEVLK